MIAEIWSTFLSSVVFWCLLSRSLANILTHKKARNGIINLGANLIRIFCIRKREVFEKRDIFIEVITVLRVLCSLALKEGHSNGEEFVADTFRDAIAHVCLACYWSRILSLECFTLMPILLWSWLQSWLNTLYSVWLRWTSNLVFCSVLTESIVYAFSRYYI